MFIAKLQISSENFKQEGYEKIFTVANEVKVLYSLVQTEKSHAEVLEIEWKKKPLPDKAKEFEFVDEIIEISSDKNTYLYLIRGKQLPYYGNLLEEITDTFKCFFEYPVIMKEDFAILPVVGEKEKLSELFNFLKDIELEFSVISMRKYYSFGKGILSNLTPKQYKVLKFAVENGYYDIPRKKDARKLGKKYGFFHTAFLMHLRRAERRLYKILFP